jgi:hypothetical protein
MTRKNGHFDGIAAGMMFALLVSTAIVSEAGQLSKVLLVDMCGTNGAATACHPTQTTSGLQMMQGLATAYNFTLTVTTNANEFTDAVLKTYDVVVFNNVGNNPFTSGQAAAFRKYIYDGGGYIGWHASAATHATWQWYTDTLIGADIYNHGIADKALPVTRDAAYLTHPILSGVFCNITPGRALKDTTMSDEWYFYLPDPSVNPLFTKLLWITENNVKRAMSWCQEFNKGGTQPGRMFYTNCGQNNIVGGNNFYTNSYFKQLVINALRWAAHVSTTCTVTIQKQQESRQFGAADIADLFCYVNSGKAFVNVYTMSGQRVHAGTLGSYKDLMNVVPAGCHIVRFSDASGRVLHQMTIAQ